MPILDWLDRDRDVRAADAVPYRLLETVDGLSSGDPAAPNMLIQGDNLEALKALLPYYSGQVKCIFIDPPHHSLSGGKQGAGYNMAGAETASCGRREYTGA